MPDIKNNNDHQFIKVYNKVKLDKNLDYLEKLILSEIISYQLQGKVFFKTNKSLAFEYGCSENTIQKRITKLQPLLFNETFYPHNPNGGRPPKRRKLLVENLYKYIPIEVLIEINIDIKSFKDIEDFIRWAKCTFTADGIIETYVKAKPYIERHFGKLF